MIDNYMVQEIKESILDRLLNSNLVEDMLHTWFQQGSKTTTIEADTVERKKERKKGLGK